MFVQHWKWRQASKNSEVWFVSWWLRVLRRPIKSKSPWNAVGRNHPFQDNARPHTANLVRDKLQKFLTGKHFNIANLSPCDFHICGDLKKDIRGRRFHSDEEVQVWMRLWIHQQPTSSYKTGIDHLVYQWDKCINTCGNYF